MCTILGPIFIQQPLSNSSALFDSLHIGFSLLLGLVDDIYDDRDALE
jgi:hypothetical protein